MTQTHYIARCHCGGVQLALTFPEGVNNVRRCDCSMCRRRGAPVASVSLANLKLVSGAELTSCYQFNTHTAKHYFCSRCGIYTHHQRRSNPEEYGVNLGCIDDLDPFTFKDAPVMDGINHPADREAS
ncbi:GFA family protein [Shewanella chilikensis]|uniref:GFA family protein n=1 Tax=Shewanella chilikensis TaxID=558541 RepID=A0A6G7LN93_9GAMM|nr:GFA family protein [Shewanella chilikensis]QIJ03125.1 GFA family protein [Shewanella chilikensis]